MRKWMIWLSSVLGVLVLGLFLAFVFVQHEQTRIQNAEPGLTEEQKAYWDALSAHQLKFKLRYDNTEKLMKTQPDSEELFQSVEDTLALTREVKFIRYPDEYEEFHLGYMEVMARFENVYSYMEAYLYGETEDDPQAFAAELNRMTVQANWAYAKLSKLQKKTYLESGEDLHDDR
ncbi:hypothetical protein EV586_103292 [Tumebacillus sp. BK434]|uniref:hypothetical protein n=1 Tax=Tumebacillus sp. BK434 TaxID=2512169 RepID=UPI001051E96C|nr:hypothetical protein [Tumebacillus sp. BK434]TCP55639.1 hypothetical protein EV586_103292 [Tumebacillus sp. BK434]